MNDFANFRKLPTRRSFPSFAQIVNLESFLGLPSCNKLVLMPFTIRTADFERPVPFIGSHLQTPTGSRLLSLLASEGLIDRVSRAASRTRDSRVDGDFWEGNGSKHRFSFTIFSLDFLAPRNTVTACWAIYIGIYKLTVSISVRVEKNVKVEPTAGPSVPGTERAIELRSEVSPRHRNRTRFFIIHIWNLVSS